MEANSLTRVAETTALAHGASETATAKSGYRRLELMNFYKNMKMEKKYKLWVARDWGGMLYAYFNKPIRDTFWKEWDSDKVSLSIDDLFFPELKWEDEPIEVELRPAITDIDSKANEYANSVTDNKEIRELIINAFKAGYNS